MRLVGHTAAALLLGALLCWPAVAVAQSKSSGKRGAGKAAAAAKRAPAPAEPAAVEPSDEKPEVDVERSGKKKVYRIKTELVIEGRIQKPNAFYVLQRSTINYDWMDTKQRFVPRILHSVKQSPF